MLCDLVNDLADSTCTAERLSIPVSHSYALACQRPSLLIAGYRWLILFSWKS